MQFISFIALTMLIVLISQDLTMGLPINETSIEKQCSEGFKMVDGQCISMNSKPDDGKMKRPFGKKVIVQGEPVVATEETILVNAELVIPTKKPAVYKKNSFNPTDEPVNTTEEPISSTGEPISSTEEPISSTEEPVSSTEEPVNTTEESVNTTQKLVNAKQKLAGVTEEPINATEEPVIVTEKPVFFRKNPPLIKDGACPEGMKHGEHGICQDIQPSKTTKKITKPKIFKEDSIPEKESCPEGMKNDENGVCQKIKSSKNTKVTPKPKTVLKEDPEGEENLSGCPEGTKHDDQGSCQEIKPSSTTKAITDPKILLKKDGSCPDNYKMIEDRCLYIKPKTQSSLYPDGTIVDNGASTGIRPKNGNSESDLVEKVPVLSDNSCPEGTEYSEYGLCQKRILPSKLKLNMKPDGGCPNDFELVNGKCTYKKSKIQNQSRSSTTTGTFLVTFEAATQNEESINNDNLSDIEITTVEAATSESQ